MRKDRLCKVEQELTRYNQAVAALRSKGTDSGMETYYGSKETGAVRRASLDLSRALADLRKPD